MAAPEESMPLVMIFMFYPQNTVLVLNLLNMNLNCFLTKCF